MANQEVTLMKGNEAIAHACIRCGADGFFGYPITPQSEIIETLALLKPWETSGMVVLQAESEVAAINMVYGGAGAGKRVITTSSSPGVALMQEGISYMAGAEIPGVIVNVQRGGPGLGTIQPSQSDYFQATRGGGNGGYNDGARQASFFVLERYESGTMTHSLEASDAKFNPETKRWTAPRYTKREFDSAGTETFEQFRNLDTLINLEATELGEINDLIQTMNISELNAFLDQQRAKGSDSINLIEVEKHARYAYPLSTFILTLIGVSLSSRKVRGGTGLHIGIGTGLCFSYILFNRFFEEFAKSGTLPPGLAVWLPNIIYLGIAVYLYRKAPK